MTGGVMVFASLIAAPASAFFCSDRWLAFFVIYPIVSLAEGRLAYFRNLFFIALPPALAFLWAVLSNHPESASRAVRWVCAVASGVYFAGTLGPDGIAGVLDMAGAGRLSETMLMAGDAASTARSTWKRNGELTIGKRIAVTVRRSVSIRNSPNTVFVLPGPIPVTVAAVSWVFLLLSISWRAL